VDAPYHLSAAPGVEAIADDPSLGLLRSDHAADPAWAREEGAMRFMQYHPRALVGDGGVTRSVRSLAAAMADLGAQSSIAYEGQGSDPADGSKLGVEWIGVRHRGVGGVKVPIGLGQSLSGVDWLILNSAWSSHNARAGAVARKVGVPYVVASRGAYDPMILRRRPLAKRAWWIAFERRLVQRARALHVFFASQEASVRALGFQGPVIVAPNGVKVPDGLSWDGGSGGYLLYVGRFDPEHKGLDLLVRAVATLPPARRPELRLHGPDWRGGKERTRALVDRVGVGRWVAVGPPVHGPEKWELISAARGFVYPSRWEGFGNAPAEAAALGVPVLVTDYPMGRHLADVGAALRCEPTVRSLADGVAALADGIPGIGGRGEKVRSAFDWKAVAGVWVSPTAELK
jgi:glycosyltransferase involved in cell wall biosynthesis